MDTTATTTLSNLKLDASSIDYYSLGDLTVDVSNVTPMTLSDCGISIASNTIDCKLATTSSYTSVYVPTVTSTDHAQLNGNGKYWHLPRYGVGVDLYGTWLAEKSEEIIQAALNPKEFVLKTRRKRIRLIFNI